MGSCAKDKSLPRSAQTRSYRVERRCGQRVRIHQAVLLPDGTEARLVASLKGNVVVCVGDVLRLDESEILRRREHELRLAKNSSAVALGHRKLGQRERPSERKVEACRRNAACPVRPGSRPRGRPRGKRQAEFVAAVSDG